MNFLQTDVISNQQKKISLHLNSFQELLGFVATRYLHRLYTPASESERRKKKLSGVMVELHRVP